MKGPSIVIIILIMLAPLASACFSPMDSLAVEVYLNRPRITYDLTPLQNAGNVSLLDGRIVYRSHYDGRVAVMLWEEDGLHIRIEIPPKSFNSTYAHAELRAPLIIENETLEKLRKAGWAVENLTLEKKNIRIIISPLKERECTSDRDCATGGCSGEVCTTREAAKEVVSVCVYRPWYSCFEETTCGCYNGVCTWKPNERFEECLRGHGVDPEKVIKLPEGEVYAAVYGKDKPSPEELEEIKAALMELGVCGNLTFTSETVDAPSGVVDEYTFDFKAALREELQWLRENGVVSISDEDLEGIVKVAERGKAGHNSHIGWYEDKNGTYRWIPYDESSNPSLVRCVSTPESYTLPPGDVALPKETPVETTHSPSATETTAAGSPTCGPAFVAALALLPLLMRRR